MTVSAKLDVTRQLEDLSELEKTRLAVTSAGEVIYDIVVSDGTIVWGDNAEELFRAYGLSPASTRQEQIDSIKQESRFVLNAAIEHSSSTGEPFEVEYQMNNLLGGKCWVEDRGSCICDESGNVNRIVGLIRFINERKKRETRLMRLAVYDDLTGFFNRSHLHERVDEANMRVEQVRVPFCYLVIGVDDLAVINESYGFDVADDVILEVSRRIAKCLRAEDAAGRVAGNKFGILVSNSGKDVMLRTVLDIQNSVREDVIVTRSGPVSASVSAGCISVLEPGTTAQEIMARAEEALSVAKSQGCDRFHCYERSEQRESARRRKMIVADEIVSAINNNRVTLAYQPIVRADDRSVEFYECLLRIVDREGNLMPAGSFVPIAEELGLIRILDRHVLELGIQKLKEHKDLRLSINVSGLTAADPAWIQSMLDMVDDNRDVASRMIVEITETVAIGDVQESVNFVNRLREFGCETAIDDFGAGYTSFRNLQALAINMVKIDGSFIRGIDLSEDNQFFVKTLIDLANNFNLKTVAEWVGNDSEIEVLKEMGIDYFQGFMLGRPEIGRF